MDTGCLPAEQQQQMLELSKKLIAEFELEENIARFKELNSERMAAFSKANECQAQRQSLDPLKLFGAILDLGRCEPILNQYNALVQQCNSLQEQIEGNQALVLRQLTLQRMVFPACH